ncbi:MAG: hypothetical protein MZV64_22870 [Ignavibacteriales bacterium]|nr:hypothetical protein [Ignavibacteriales bacterium]
MILKFLSDLVPAGTPSISFQIVRDVLLEVPDEEPARTAGHPSPAMKRQQGDHPSRRSRASRRRIEALDPGQASRSMIPRTTARRIVLLARERACRASPC